MRLELINIKDTAVSAYRSLSDGRISRTTFVIRVVILIAVIAALAAPATTILATSSQTLRDVYSVLALSVAAISSIGIINAYVKRLHDIGVRGYWALVALVVLPAAILWGGTEYNSYRYSLDNSHNTADLYDVLGYLALIPPIVIGMWRGEHSENRYGPVPDPVEHVFASKISLAAAGGAAAILIPTSIYAGIFQSGVWVGRGELSPSMPMIESHSNGRLLAKCWNIKGVGAGTGDGPLSGVYRDGYDGVVFDFVVSDDGEIDVIPAGETLATAFRADGFQIYPYGLDASDGYRVGDRKHFLIAAMYDGSDAPVSNVNITTFSFAKTGEYSTNWQMVMSTGMNIGAGETSVMLNQTDQARGRLMVGDCIVRY